MHELPLIDPRELRADSGKSAVPSPDVPKGTYAFVSLGCPKNLVDSERMLGLLASEGYIPVSDPRGADLVIVNTCGFIESARQESRAVIEEMTQLKEQGQVRGVIVTGCLAERLGDQILKEMPLVDQAVGVFGREEIVQVADRFMNGVVEQRTLFRPAAVRALPDTARLRVTPRHYAYLKISEGCDRTCTFCAIPGMRGKHVSKPIEQVVEEAIELVSDGVRELILVSQDTTYYGKDLYGEVRLAELLTALDAVEDLRWIRILYAYPEHIDDRLIETCARARRIIPYLDMPLQHINDRVLKRMQRRVDRRSTETLLSRLRAGWPDLSLRTTFIVGFPGETDAQFDELLEFVAASRFERAGVFPYSFEEGTPATRLDGHLSEAVKEDRRRRLMECQQTVAFDVARSMIGRDLDVVVDTMDAGNGTLICRGWADAPDIDALVHVRVPKGRGRRAPRTGDFVRVRVIGTRDYDLEADLVATDGAESPSSPESRSGAT